LTARRSPAPIATTVCVNALAFDRSCELDQLSAALRVQTPRERAPSGVHHAVAATLSSVGMVKL
jgi:hypothetical protein